MTISMKHFLAISVIILLHSGLAAQSTSADTVKLLVVAGKDPLPGANCLVHGTTIGTVTDRDGVATLIVSADKKKVGIYLMDPYVELRIVRPVDSIHFDLDSRKATYYSEKKKIKTRKQIVRDLSH